jgi:hypothetical protein
MCSENTHICNYCKLSYICNEPNYVCATLNFDENQNMCSECHDRLEKELQEMQIEEIADITIYDILMNGKEEDDND